MSKKLSKVLVVAVVLVLAMSAVALVACGGPEPLEGKTAMATLQKDFNKANGKAVENIKLGGLDVDVAGIVQLQVKNVDIALVRTYNAEGVMNIDATISNLQVAMPKGLSIIAGAIKVPKDIRQPKGEQVAINLDNTVVDNFKHVILHANVDIEGETSKVTVKKFEIKNLNKVVDAKGNILIPLRDGDNNAFGAVYEPGEIKDTVVDPRHKKNPADEKDLDGLYTAMDKYSTNKAGTILESFVAENYKMLSLYTFGEVTVDKETLKSNAVADLSKVYDLGDQVLAGYKDAELKEGNANSKLGKILNKVFGTTEVKSIVESITDLGTSKIDMTAGIKADGDSWKLTSLKATQKITVTLSKDVLSKVAGKGGLLDAMGVTLPDAVAKMIPNILKSDIVASIDVAINSTYEY